MYVLAPSADEQKDRLVGRQSESGAALTERPGQAGDEIRYARECGAYDYFVVNEKIDETVDAVSRIVRERNQV